MQRGLLICCCVLTVSVAQAQQVLTQKAEIQPSLLRGTPSRRSRLRLL